MSAASAVTSSKLFSVEEAFMIKSLKLASHNWRVLIKSIIYQAVLLALIIALGVLIFGNLADDLLHVWSENNVADFVNNSLNSIVSGEFNSDVFADELGALIANVQQSISDIQLPWGGVALSYVAICAILVVYRLLVSITDVTVDCQLNEFMTSNANRPFTWYFFKKQGRTWQFALLQAAFAIPLDVLIICGSVGFYLMFLLAFNWWTIIPVAVLAVLFYVVRLTLFAFCLPSVACEEDMSTRDAFKHGLSTVVGRFWHVFWKTLIVVALMAAISIISILFVQNTIAKAILSTVPNFVLFFYLKCVNIVEYFRADNRPFFYKRVDVEGTERYNRRLARKAKRNKA